MQTIKKFQISAVLIACAAMLMPGLALAQLHDFACPQGLNCSGVTGSSGVVAVNGFITTIVNWLLSIAFGLAVLFLIIGGLRFILSGGNEESAEKAKNTVVNALIGIVLIILSYVIVNVVVSALSASAPTTAP